MDQYQVLLLKVDKQIPAVEAVGVDGILPAVKAAAAALVLSSSDTYLQYKESIPSQPLVL